MSKLSVHSHGRKCRRALARLAVCLTFLTLALTGSAAADQSDQQRADSNATEISEKPSHEYLIKAAILYNFAKFTRWPAESFDSVDAPLQLCVIGVDPFGSALESIDGKRVGARSLQISQIADTTQVFDCHLLFVSTSESKIFTKILETVGRAAILTVAEIPDFSRAGGIITLDVIKDRTRFDVNHSAAERAGLELSAKLLRLADHVIQEGS